MLKRLFSQQARKPSGLFGRIVAPLIFDKGNALIHDGMVALAAPAGEQRILEIGFGTGGTVSAMAAALDGGTVEGVDLSPTMLTKAVKRNRAHIRAGRVHLALGDFDSIEYPPERFDTVCSSNTIYFWPDPAATLARIHNVLKPGGKIVLGFVAKSRMSTMPLDMEVFTPVSRQDLAGLLSTTGYLRTEMHAVGPDGGGQYCAVAWK